MNKRIRKKKHKEFIGDVNFEISISYEWRKRLDLAEPRLDILITKKDLVELMPWYSGLIEKYNFQYVVHKDLLDATPADKEAIFVFSARRFPTITDWSYNNLNVL